MKAKQSKAYRFQLRSFRDDQRKLLLKMPRLDEYNKTKDTFRDEFINVFDKFPKRHKYIPRISRERKSSFEYERERESGLFGGLKH